jgi:CRP/FNR family transcriptional regulator
MGEPILARAQGTYIPSCNQCSLSNICLPIAVSHEDLYRLEAVVSQGKIFDRGELVFRQCDRFKSCFAVQGGAIKTYFVSEDGEKQVTGFYLPGEVVALDSVSTNHYSCSAEALERSSLCEIPLNRLEELAARIPSLQQHFFQLMSHEIQSGQQMSMLLSRRTADERLASFLLSLSTRFNRRRLSPTHFRLPMARNDIANYLGLAVETVSRVLTRFQKQELVLFHGRNCTLVDIDGLKNIVHHYNSLCE